MTREHERIGGNKANPPISAESPAAEGAAAAIRTLDEVDIDVTDILGDIALGDDWFGVRLEIDDDVGNKTFYASDSPKGSYHPQLQVEWGFAPYPPTDLDPSGGQVVGVATPVLQWRFPDIVQENTQAASRVQITTTGDTTFAAPTFLSANSADTVAASTVTTSPAKAATLAPMAVAAVVPS